MLKVPPVGSFSAGNISEPHIVHAATAVTMPAKPRKAFCDSVSTVETRQLEGRRWWGKVGVTNAGLEGAV